MDPMLIVLCGALGATAIALFIGLLAMSGGERVDRDLSEPLMWARVGFQALTLLLLGLAVWLR